METQSVFSLATQLESVYGGVDAEDIRAEYPKSGAVTNSFVGSGDAGSITQFEWTEQNWWCPASSYFILRFKFGKYVGTSFDPIQNYDADGDINLLGLVAYADNFVSTLFDKIEVKINGKTLETINQPWVVDQILTYTKSRKGYLDTFSTVGRAGESLMDRLSNTYNRNTGVVEVCYRPPSSLFDVKIVPPGAQYQVLFNWRSSAAYAFESLIGGLTIGNQDTNYNVLVNDFRFFKATVKPSRSVALPDHGIIDLYPSQLDQYAVSSANNITQNIKFPGTTNRVFLTFQDANNSVVVQTLEKETVPKSPYTPLGPKFQGFGNGWNPATSFSKSFSIAGGLTTTEMTSLYIILPDINAQLPTSTYNFNNGSVGVGTNGNDYLRAYMDFATYTQGTKYADEGGLPFGYAINGFSLPTIKRSTIGPTAVLPDLEINSTATPVYKSGNPSNKNNLTLISDIVTVPADLAATTDPKLLFFQTSEYGWLGRYPGPIYVFNTPRPDGVKMINGTIRADFSTTVANVTISILSSYTNALIVKKNEYGMYDFMLAE